MDKVDEKMKPWQQVQGIYVHIPFCVQKCLYCDFTSFACYDDEFKNRYAHTVVKEIEQKSSKSICVNEKATIYFGGGTPSVMPLDDISIIVQSLKQHGFWRNPAEAVIEVNPGTADLRKLIGLRELGFDRISFGIQSLNNNELKQIGRIHTSEEALNAVEMARQAGFKRINADIMYGLPGQNMASLKNTLQQITATGIEHISVYGLILEEETPLAKMVEQDKMILPDEDLCADMYEFVQSFLRAEGFTRYEISNYAKNEQYSKHNLVYWHYYPYLAFGAAACGFNGKKRFTGTMDVKKYVEQGLQGSFAYVEEELSVSDMLGEFMFMNLRKQSGANLYEAQERFGVDVYSEYKKEIDNFIAQGLLNYDRQTKVLSLTENGMEVGNQIFEIFVRV